MLFTDPEIELLTEPEALLTGAGTFEITEFGCTLLSLRIGGLELSRDQCAQAASEADVQRIEGVTLEGYRDQHQSAAWHFQADREHEFAEVAA